MIYNSSVCLVAPFPPPYGGMGVRFEQMAVCLEKEGVTIERIRLEAANSRLSRIRSFLRPAFQVLKQKNQIIHLVTGSIPNFIALTPIFLAAKISCKKIILSNGGGFWEEEAASRSIRHIIVSLVLKLPDIIICCNKGLARATVNLGVKSEKIAIISNALPDEKGARAKFSLPDDFTQIHQNADKVLLYVGGLKSWYGLIETLEMTKQLQRKGINCVLVALVKKGGDRDFHSCVMQKVRDLSLLNSFYLYTSVPWAVSAIAQSDLFIRATNVIEGDSRSVREALSVGTPVIASNIGHRPEGVTLFKAGDSSSMTKAALSALNKHRTPSNLTSPNNSEGKKNLQRIIGFYKEL